MWSTNLHATSATFDILLVPLLLVACYVAIHLDHTDADLPQPEAIDRYFHRAKKRSISSAVGRSEGGDGGGHRDRYASSHTTNMP